MLRRMRLLAVAVAALMVMGLASPAIAGERSVATQDPVTVAELGADLARTAEARGLEEISVPVGIGEVVVRYEGNKVNDPDISIGFGWNIYLYLDRGDFIFLAGLGAAAATSLLCAILISSANLGGAVACGVAAYIVTYYIIGKVAPAPGYCREFKIRYWGSLAGVKDVRRSC